MKLGRLKAAVLAFVLAFVMPTASETCAREPERKDETIYVNLDYSGNILETIVVNAIKVPASGLVTDYGSYLSVKNLTDGGEPRINHDLIQWQTNPENDMFYYQGILPECQLPWVFAISYRLDGQIIEPELLPGAAGRLEITIDADANNKVRSYFQEQFMAQISVSFDTNCCRNISAPEAMLVTAGSMKNVVYTILPSTSKTFRITMDISNFEMDGFSINLIEFSNTLLDGVDSLESGMYQLSSGMDRLTEGTAQLQAGAQDLDNSLRTLNDFMRDITRLTPDLSDGFSSVDGALGEMNGGLQNIIGASSQIREGVGSLASNAYEIENGFSAIEGGLAAMAEQKVQMENGLDLLEKSEPDLSELTDGAEEFTKGLSKVVGASRDQAGKTHALLLKMMDLAPTNPEIAGLIQDVMIINGMAEGVSYGLINLSAGFQGMESGLDEVSSGINTLYDTADQFGHAALELMEGAQELHAGVKTLNGGLRSYFAGVLELAGNYTTFDQSLNQFGEGFQDLHSSFGTLITGVGGLFSALNEVKGGVETLSRNVEQLPENVRLLLNAEQQAGASLKTAVYTVSDQLNTGDGASVPVSFVAPGKVVPNSIQFILRTPDIRVADTPVTTVEDKKPENFWERLKALFI